MKIKTKILQFGNNTGILLSEEQLKELGGGMRPLVVVSLNQYTIRGAVGKMDGMYLVSLSAAHRKNAGVNGGEELLVTIKLDTEKRGVEIPVALQKVFNTNPSSKIVFDKLAPSKQKAMVLSIAEAKSKETRERRLEKVILSLNDTKSNKN